MAPTRTASGTSVKKSKSKNTINKRGVRFTKKQPVIIPDTATAGRLPSSQFYSQQELIHFRRDIMEAISRRQKGDLTASDYEWRGLEDHIAEGGMQASEKRCQAVIHEVVTRHSDLVNKRKGDGEVNTPNKDDETLRRLASAKSANSRKQAALKALQDAKDAKEIYDQNGIDTTKYKSLASITYSPKQQQKKTKGGSNSPNEKKTKGRSDSPNEKRDKLNKRKDKLERKGSIIQTMVKSLSWKREKRGT